VNNQNSQIIYKGASRVVWEAAPWEPTRSKIATSRRSELGYQESPNWDARSWGPEGITRLGQGGRHNPINKVLALRLEDNEYNKPEGRAVDRYGIELSCPGEPYGFDLRGPEATCPNPEYQKSRHVQPRSQHHQEQCAR